MVLGLICALAAALCYGTATVLQAMAARDAAPGTGSGADLRLLLRAARQWRFLAGLACDGLGFALEVVALRSLPVYTVGAALAASLAVTALLGSRWLRLRLHRREWAAIGLVCAGLAVLALSSGSQGHRPAPDWLAWALLGAAVLVPAAGLAAGRLHGRARALTLGLVAGLSFGIVEVVVRLIDRPFPAMLADPAPYALAIGGAAAFMLLTAAFNQGSVTVATAGMVLGETIGPALIGVVWLGDRAHAGLAPLAVVGFAAAVAGALALSRFGDVERGDVESPTPAISGGP